MANTLISIVTVLAALGPGSEPAAPCNESIRQQDLKADLFFLAGDAFQGRLTGTAGNTMAAEFIASRFERLGLERMGKDRSYFQPFLLSTASLGPSNKLEVKLYGIGTLRFRAGQDFVPLQISPSVELQDRLVFAGFGISAPERGHDDYRNADVRGVVVLVLAHEPGENDPKSPFDGLVMSEASNLLRKVLRAQEKGASGVLIVADVHNHPEPENFEALARGFWPEKPPRIPQYTLQDWAERVRIPAAMISTRSGPNAPWRGEELVRGNGSIVGAAAVIGSLDTFREGVAAHDRCFAPHRPRPQRGRRPRRLRPEAQGRVGRDLLSSRPQRCRRRSHLQRCGRQRLWDAWACSRLPRPTRWRRSRGTARSGRSCSPRSTRRSVACWGLMLSWSGR